MENTSRIPRYPRQFEMHIVADTGCEQKHVVVAVVWCLSMMTCNSLGNHPTSERGGAVK